MIITTKDIMERMDLQDKLPEIIEYLGCADMLDDVYVYRYCEEMPDKPLIETAKELKDYIYSITKAEVMHFSMQDNENYAMGDGKSTAQEYCQFRLDLWKHAGHPGGESSKYVGRINLLIEVHGFLLLAAKITG